MGLTLDGQSFMLAPAAGRGLAALILDRVPVYGSLVAVSGTTYAQRQADAAGRSWPTLANSRWPVLVDVGGQSDLLANLTAAQVVAAMEAYHAAARAAGALFTIASTIPPSTSYSAPQEAVRVQVNPLILASEAFDAVADLAAVPLAANPADATAYSDGLHPTALLAGQFADVFAGLIDDLPVPVPA